MYLLNAGFSFVSEPAVKYFQNLLLGSMQLDLDQSLGRYLEKISIGHKYMHILLLTNSHT